MAKKKSLGREKAKENTFISLGTRPEEYEPVYFKIFHQTSNCQLCGQHIGYDFLLKHKTNEEKNLYVGADCIVTFCRTHLPNMVEAMIQRMQMQMEELVEKEKAKVFQESNPTFVTDVNRLTSTIKETLIQYKTNWEFLSGKKRLPIFETVSDVDKDLRRKGYTTKPKVEKIYEALREVDSGRFAEKIKEFVENKGTNVTIQQELDSAKNKTAEEFYNVYFQYSAYIGWEKSPSVESNSLSTIEKELFLNAVEEYLASKSRLKKKLKKNKDSIVEAIRTNFSDQLMIKPVIEDKPPFYYAMKEDDKKAIKTHPFYVHLGFPYSSFKMRPYIKEYGLASVHELLHLKNEEYAEKCKAENYYVFGDKILLFQTESDARNFMDNVTSFVETKIDEISEYLESEDVANEKFH